MNQHLLRPCQGTGGLFFPIGRPPTGTCHFASDMCLKHCHAIVDRAREYDEETQVTEEEKWHIYRLTMNRPPYVVAAQIMTDLEGLQTPVLHWFASGDCPPCDETRFMQIVELIPRYIGQVGYTRSRSLWRRNKDIFTLTVETRAEMNESGRYAIPDYATETTYIESPDRRIRGSVCGPHFKEADPQEGLPEHYLSCRACWRLKSGCFDRRGVA